MSAITTQAAAFPWTVELEKTVINSLTTSFGLDFLLFEDMKGGDVDTIHNARQGIYATHTARDNYAQRGDYRDRTADYHSHVNYVGTGQQDKAAQQQGTLHDAYRNQTLRRDETRNLDHVISAKEIHDDAGRVLAGLDGVELANQSSNLQSTHESINKSKKQTPIEDYLARLPAQISQHEQTLVKRQAALARLPRQTPEQQHKVRELEDQIRKDQEKIRQLKTIDPDVMRQKDREARQQYNQQINVAYYTSSEFLKSSAMASGLSGLKMGTRQMLGLIMAEIWFELRTQLPLLIDKVSQRFELGKFIDIIKDTLQGIWTRVRARFKDFLTAFKDGVFSGVMASAATTLFNIFVTTQKASIKIIREMWGHLVKAVKLLVFNPEKLGFTELCKAVVSVLSVGTATVVGSLVYTQIAALLSFPFGAEIATFAGALTTGLITLGLGYFLLHSDTAKKIWDFVESTIPYGADQKQFQAINAELDRYLDELGRLEFNINVDELEEFADALAGCNTESERSAVLQKQLAAQGIELSYEMGNSTSTRKWLSSMVKK